MPVEPVPDLDGEWDEGLAPERTQLAWGRTGLAVVVAVGVLSRRVWTLHGAAGVVGLIVVASGALLWLAGMLESRRPDAVLEIRGASGGTGFGMITAGTVLLALGGLVFGILVSS